MVRRIAANPTTTFTAVRVSRMPTLNASRAVRGGCPPQGVDEERLLGADPTRAHGDERGQALRRLHEEDVADALLDAERAEEEPDRGEPEPPVAELPEHDLAQPSCRAFGRS